MTSSALAVAPTTAQLEIVSRYLQNGDFGNFLNDCFLVCIKWIRNGLQKYSVKCICEYIIEPLVGVRLKVVPTRSIFYKKRSKNVYSRDFSFLYSCFLFFSGNFG